MNSLKEGLTAAIEAKNNDITTFVWKGPKEELNGQKFQEEIRLVDAADEQLMAFYEHCKSMLYSKDPINPGRYTLVDLIQEDREKCNTELYLRYLEGVYMPDQQRSKYPRFMYLQAINKYLSRNSDTYPANTWNELPISEFTDGVPEEFTQIPVNMVMDGCLDKLGKIHKKPITLNFLTKLGVWLTPDEMRDLTEHDENTGKVRDRLEVIKERLGLKPIVRLRVNPTGLSYAELRAMVNLKNKKFSELTTEQLLVLRNRILFLLENHSINCAELWIQQMRNIRMVANSRGWDFEDNPIY